MTGKQLFEQEKYEEAYNALFKAFQEDPTSLDISFLLGRAAFESGRYEEAVMTFDRVLIMQPDAQRVKLELARAHLKLGSREMAKQYFREVLATKPPQQVWDNIQNFLEAIADSEKKHFLSGTLSLGASWDDNVRLSPTSSTIPTSLSSFELTGESASPQDDMVYNNTLVLNHIFKPEDKPFTTWKTSITNYNAFYENQNDLDVNFFGLNSGPVFQAEKYLLDIQAFSNYIDVQYDRYQSSFGLAPSLTLVATPTALVNLGIKVEEKNNYSDATRDSTNIAYSAGSIFIASKSRMHFTFSKEYENADSGVHSYNRIGWQFRLEHDYPRDINAYANLGYKSTKYDAITQLFDLTRSDKVHEYSLGVSKLLWKDAKKGQVLIGQLAQTYTRSKSNIQLYDYSKNVTAFSLTFNF